MTIENLGLNVEDPQAMADWYCENLGFKVIRQPHANCLFITDGSGNGIIEIYNNAGAEVPDYRKIDPLVFHIAYTSQDVQADTSRLLAAGASLIGEVNTTPAGDVMAFLKDPWGIAIQLAKRKQGL